MCKLHVNSSYSFSTECFLLNNTNNKINHNEISEEYMAPSIKFT